MTIRPQTLDLGRSAFSERRWSDAFDCLARADTEGGLPPQDIELVASVAMLLGHERAERGLPGTGPRRIPHHGRHGQCGPLRCVAGLFLMDMGEPARGVGWLSRARHLVEGHGRTLRSRRVPPHSGGAGCACTGELRRPAMRCSAGPWNLGRSFHDKDLQALGQLGVGTSRRLPWDSLEEGLQLLDEVMVSVTPGKFRPSRRDYLLRGHGQLPLWH